MIKVLVVDDSPVVREFLVHIFNSDPDIRVVGIACDGEEALRAVRRQRPDVITMDIHMPKLNGLDATRAIMETEPTPIVIVSGTEDPSEVATTFNAMDAGALAVLRRPAGIGHPDHEAMAQDMVQTVKLMSEVRVIRRWPGMRTAAPAPRPEIPRAETSLSENARLARESAKPRIVAIGASTGGPPALETILASLPKDFPVPILIVQHMSPGFIRGFARWLANSSRLPVRVAAHGESLLPGHVYVAPDEYQMKVEREGKIALTKNDPEHGLRPSISYLFRAVAEVYGADAVAGLLTGMGRDGAKDLKLLKERGAITFAQDKDSSVVHGMPGEAIKLDAAMLILPLEKIAAALTNLVNHREKLERDLRHSK
ncbi:protein-glutamate methylesterase/protein-glutamine glutaminase [Nitrosovibrio tenuis]|uniref:Protein-glutamate methylesterase/protein-glutamine glutaminase n=1 Tax=Nitrosovibrio tenuis TaxID=1233 RepID=A0A1H7KGB1_9PROT|nr:chemotaxis response regulator protein-glutamate methylesterase [Nitrosovibrio tenuis]SEK85829.1 two-component system, chemotaxis family, response regulator CheB [Nitrosovibrio tenuis]